MSPGELDAIVVRRHLAALQNVVRRLRKHASIPLARLEADVDAQWAVERGLQLAAQNALDVAAQVAAAEGHDPGDYASAIDALGDAGVLPVELGGRLRAIAGFRNVLVHAYLDVDLDVVHDALLHRLDELDELVAHASAYLERRDVAEDPNGTGVA